MVESKNNNMSQFLEKESLRYISEITNTPMDFFRTLNTGVKNNDVLYELFSNLYELGKTSEETVLSVQIYKYLLSSEEPKHDIEILEEIKKYQTSELKATDIRKILIKFYELGIVKYVVEKTQKNNKMYHEHKFYPINDMFEKRLSKEYVIIVDKLKTKLNHIDEDDYMCLNFGDDAEPIKSISYEEIKKLSEIYDLKTFYDVEFYLDNYESGINCITDIPIGEIYGTNLMYGIEELEKTNETISLINQDINEKKIILAYVLTLMSKDSFGILNN
ncbi:hypothetical protein GQ473_06355 [archaeon]|nr:hypothetical protein [archaeon]